MKTYDFIHFPITVCSGNTDDEKKWSFLNIEPAIFAHKSLWADADQKQFLDFESK